MDSLDLNRFRLLLCLPAFTLPLGLGESPTLKDRDNIPFGRPIQVSARALPSFEPSLSSDPLSSKAFPEIEQKDGPPGIDPLSGERSRSRVASRLISCLIGRQQSCQVPYVAHLLKSFYGRNELP